MMRFSLSRFLCLCLLGLVLLGAQAQAHTCVIGSCPNDCSGPRGSKTGEGVLKRNHEKGEKDIIKDHKPFNLVDRMTTHKFWTAGNYFINNILPAMINMATQMSTVGFEQMRIVGQLFDAKNLMDSLTVVQELQVEAHKDYQPSESFCWYGTNVRALAESESRGRFTQTALAKINLSRQLGVYHNAASEEPNNDLVSRWNQFSNAYCDPFDNNWRGAGGGLQAVCSNPGGNRDRINNDVDYTRVIDNARTLDVDLHDGDKTNMEEDVIALSSNLYGHKPLLRDIPGLDRADSGAQPNYQLLRSAVAKRAVAQDSYNAIVGLKSESTDEGDVRQYMAAIIRDTGLDPENGGQDILEYLGEKPSYYAQLEVLSKKIAQNPNFFVTLMDKPVNVKRKQAAMNAVELMLDRAIFESELRQEMIMSVLLTSYANDEYNDLNPRLKFPVTVNK